MTKKLLTLSKMVIGITLALLAGILIVMVSHSRISSPQNSSLVTTREFQSQRLGVSFKYVSRDLGNNILVDEVGSTIYVYPDSIRREQGQHVQVFEKQKDETLSQAIQRQFLTPQQLAQCQIKSGVDTNGTQPATGIAAIIAFPLGIDANSDGLELRKNCPDQYSLTNGLSYFWAPSEQSTKFVFFSIGQYYIPSTTEGAPWHTTLHFLNT